MKKPLFTVLIILLFQLALSAQEIPNPGFENWDGATGDPIDWLRNSPPSGQATVFQSLNAHSGTWSAALRVQEVGGIPLLPVLSAGADGTGFPVTQRYEALNGFYEFTPDSGDVFSVSVQMWTGGTQGTLIGGGNFNSFINPGNWTQFSAPITYTQAGIPDWCTIIITVITKQNILTTAVVDDLSFGSASSVEQIDGNPVSYKLSQNYPNPFNPSTTIQFSIPTEEFVSLSVFNSLGEKVSTLISENLNAGTYKYYWNASDLPSGIYFYRLNANEYSVSKKMILLK